MKYIILLVALFITGCGASSDDQIETAVPEIKAIEHHYSLKDGYDYGYEQALSQEDIQQGQAAVSLAMFKYSGEKDGVFQAYSKDGSVATVVECGNPCEFLKVMVFGEGVGHVSTERMRLTPGTIGWSVINDAQNGKLEQFVGERNGKKYTVWWTEKKASPEFTWLDN